MNSSFLLVIIVVLFISTLFIFWVVLNQKNLFKNKFEETEFLLQQLLTIEKYERKKINVEIHDKLQGDLSAVKIFIHVSKKLNDESQREIINSKIQQALEDAINNAKRLSHKIMPQLIDNDSLVSVAENYFTSANNSSAKHFDIKVKESGFSLSIDKNHELFRILLELHHNAIYHGNATTFSLLFYEDENYYFIEFTDNGKAFNYFDSLRESKGNGLRKIALFLKLTHSELIQREVPEGNHLVLKINKEV